MQIWWICGFVGKNVISDLTNSKKVNCPHFSYDAQWINVVPNKMLADIFFCFCLPTHTCTQYVENARIIGTYPISCPEEWFIVKMKMLLCKKQSWTVHCTVANETIVVCERVSVCLDRIGLLSNYVWNLNIPCIKFEIIAKM